MTKKRKDNPNFVNAGFQNNPQNINRNGRPKKIYTILKEKGFSKDDTITAFKEIAFYTLKELAELKTDESKPIITRIVAGQFVSAYEKQDWYKIKEILEHTIGRPVQQVNQDLTVQSEQPLFKLDLSNEEDD